VVVQFNGTSNLPPHAIRQQQLKSFWFFFSKKNNFPFSSPQHHAAIRKPGTLKVRKRLFLGKLSDTDHGLSF